MQSQDATDTFLIKWWPQIEANKNKIAGVAGAIALVIVIGAFISWRHEQNLISAGEAMTQAAVTLPPSTDPARVADAYLAIGDEYRGTPTGERSMLLGAAALFAEGKYADAQSRFQGVLDAHPDGEYSGQAGLGVAKSLEAQGKLNDAAGAYQHVIEDLADPQAVIDAKFSLAQVDLQQHNDANALQLFQDVEKADPYGTLGNEAAQYAFTLQPKSPSVSATMTPGASPMTAPVVPTAPPPPAPTHSSSSPAPFNLSH